MIVVDSSAWVERLRLTGSAVAQTLDRLLREGASLAVTEVVVGEVLAGARDAEHADKLLDALSDPILLPLHGLHSYVAAAELSRACRGRGLTLGLADFLVALPAIDAGAPVLHADADFERMSEITPLKTYPLDGA